MSFILQNLSQNSYSEENKMFTGSRKNIGMVTFLSSIIKNKQKKAHEIVLSFHSKLQAALKNPFKMRRILLLIGKKIREVGIFFLDISKQSLKIVYLATVLTFGSAPTMNSSNNFQTTQPVVPITQLDLRSNKISYINRLNLCSNDTNRLDLTSNNISYLDRYENKMKMTIGMRGGRILDENDREELKPITIEELKHKGLLIKEFRNLRKLQTKRKNPSHWTLEETVALNDLENKHGNTPQYEIFLKTLKRRKVGGNSTKNDITDVMVYLSLQPKVENFSKQINITKSVGKFENIEINPRISLKKEFLDSAEIKKLFSLSGGETTKLNKVYIQGQEKLTTYQKWVRFLKKNKKIIKIIVGSVIIITCLALLYREYVDIIAFIQYRTFHLLYPHIKLLYKNAPDDENEVFSDILFILWYNYTYGVPCSKEPSQGDDIVRHIVHIVVKLGKKHPERAKQIIARLRHVTRYFVNLPRIYKIFLGILFSL